MREISYSKSPPTCAHARILVATFGQPTGNRLYNLGLEKFPGHARIRGGVATFDLRQSAGNKFTLFEMGAWLRIDL